MLEKQDAVWLSHKSHPFMMYRKKDWWYFSPGKRIQDECHHWEPALHGCKTESLSKQRKHLTFTVLRERICDTKMHTHAYLKTYLIAEDLVQWPTTLHKAVHSSQPQAQKAVVDALHQHDLAHDEDRVPDVATEMSGHCWLTFHVQTQRTLTTANNC